jgi:hypothetical protein
MIRELDDLKVIAEQITAFVSGSMVDFQQEAAALRKLEKGVKKITEAVDIACLANSKYSKELDMERQASLDDD